MVLLYIWQMVKRIIFAETNFTPKNMINLKNSRTAIEIASLDKNNLFIRHYHVHD